MVGAQKHVSYVNEWMNKEQWRGRVTKVPAVSKEAFGHICPTVYWVLELKPLRGRWPAFNQHLLYVRHCGRCPLFIIQLKHQTTTLSMYGQPHLQMGKFRRFKTSPISGSIGVQLSNSTGKNFQKLLVTISLVSLLSYSKMGIFLIFYQVFTRGNGNLGKLECSYYKIWTLPIESWRLDGIID